MRQTFAHDAVIVMAPDGDTAAPGAAITNALCGHWDHEPPCPLAPHHTRAERLGGEVRLRVLFAAEPEMEESIRHRIDSALSAGQLRRPDGAVSRWQLRGSVRGAVLPPEVDHAARLTGG